MRLRPYGKTMSLDRKIDETRRLASRLREIHRRTVQGQITEQLHSNRIKTEIYDHPVYRLISSTDRAYLRGINDTLRDQLWQMITWRLGPADGPLPERTDGWKVPSCCLVAAKLRAIKCPICYHDLTDGASCVLGDLSRTPNALYGGHYWPGTDKLFTEYKCINRPHCATCYHDDIAHEDKTGSCSDPNCGRSCECKAFVKP